MFVVGPQALLSLLSLLVMFFSLNLEFFSCQTKTDVSNHGPNYSQNHLIILLAQFYEFYE